ncbi:B22R-like protein [Finch poxvirus]|uniref:B22R-like protein n=1 Tax=Condorpox virus TaxID=3049970 RepID=A0AAT9UNQ4_9POXV|nr:B22R-like protein [Finch poxvirus]UOX39163.1 B22R-like protein [Finch poxvirus]
MQLLIVLTVSIYIVYAYNNEIYDDDEEEEKCIRKYAKYHSLSKATKSKELSDHKASGVIRYLGIAKKKEEHRFMSCFNWTNIRNQVKKNFLQDCKINNDNYRYNYTYHLNVSVYSPSSPKRGDNTGARRKVSSCIAASVLSLSKEDVQYLICREGSNGRLDCSLPEVSSVTYTGKKCDNITADKAIVRNYTVFKDNSGNAHTDMSIIFEDLSSSYPYKDSNSFGECLSEIIDLCEKYNDQSKKVKVKKEVVSHCDDCKITLMADVTEIPEEFTKSLTVCGGLTSDKFTKLFYQCEVSGGTDCINYISLKDKMKSSAIKVLDSYLGKHIPKKSRPRRAVDEDNIDDSDLNCMYKSYDPETGEYGTCDETDTGASTSRHNKRRSKKPKRYKRSVDGKNTLTSRLKNQLGVQQVIPGDPHYLQLGLYDKHDKVIGDGKIISSLKDSVKKAFANQMPNVPSDTKPEDLLSIIRKYLSSKHHNSVLFSEVSSIGYQKITSIKETLLNNNNNEKLNSVEDVSSIKRRIKHFDIKKGPNYKQESLLKDYKKSIDYYKQSGGKKISVSSSYKTSVLGVDVGSTISIPYTGMNPGSTLQHNNRKAPILNSKDTNTLYRNTEQSHRRCRRGISSAMCGLLMLTPHNNRARNHVIRVSDSSSTDSIMNIPSGSSSMSEDTVPLGSVSSVSLAVSANEFELDTGSGRRVGDSSSLRTYTSGSNGGSRRGGNGGGSGRGSPGSSMTYVTPLSNSDRDSHNSEYGSVMSRISKTFDKTFALSIAAQLITQGLMERNLRSRMEYGNDIDETSAIFDVVSTSMSTIGGVVAASGIMASPNLAFAGMGISSIAGLLDAGRDIYYILSGKPRFSDPVIKTFNTYRDYMTDTSKTGVRKCMMPGTETIVYMAYRNDSSVVPSLEKLSLYFVDTIDSVLMYLNTSNIVLDFSLTVACPFGYLRSVDLDITSYTVLKFTTEEGVRFYKFTRLGAMLSTFPVVRLTCGKDITLTLKPFEVKLSDMQLLKMSTPGEPEETKSMPSNVCDIFPMKRFYLTVGDCPFDSSMVSVVHTTCSVLLRMATWEPIRNRWVLENPFDQGSRFRQLFTFQKFDFNNTVIKPNEIPGHSKFCASRHATECYWTDVMILDDTSSCASRSRTIYLELYTFGYGRGFTSFVLTCPSGSTPVAVGDKDGIIELPLADFYTVKMFASTKQKKIGVFCVDNYNSNFKSDFININFVEQKISKDVIYLDEFTGKERIFEDVAKYGEMPWRSKRCVTWQHKRPCISYHGKIDVWTEDFILETDVGPELMITEKYDPSTVSIQNIEKSKTLFPYELNVEFYAGNLGNAYENPGRFWDDASKKYRTYSSMVLLLIPCTMRANMMMYNISNIISVMGYHQSLTYNYGDGNKYIFDRISGSNCVAALDIKSKMISVRCEAFSIPRSIDNEGMCFITATSRDHCAAETDDIKSSGYSKEQAVKTRYCDTYISPAVWEDAGHYCGYFSSLRHVGYMYPKYEACRSYIHIHYRDVWIENEVLMKPPYAFEFKYSKSNEYINPKLSDSLKKLYEEYKMISEYTNSSLTNSINRISSSLTSDGRDITDVIVDAGVLETSYEASVEMLKDLESKITDTAHSVLMHSLSGKDVDDIYNKEELCCLIDFKKDTVTELCSRNYSCGTIDDYLYDDFTEYDDYKDDEDKVLVLINGTFEDYNFLKSVGDPVITCIDPVIIPLNNEDTKAEVEEAILMRAFKEGLEELMTEVDFNISSILLKNNISTINT